MGQMRYRCEYCGKTGQCSVGPIHKDCIKRTITRGKRIGEVEDELPVFAAFIQNKRHYLHDDCMGKWLRDYTAE